MQIIICISCVPLKYNEPCVYIYHKIHIGSIITSSIPLAIKQLDLLNNIAFYIRKIKKIYNNKENTTLRDALKQVVYMEI